MKKERILEEHKDIPYTLVGGQWSFPKEFSVLLTGKGIKTIAKKIKEKDMLRIVITDKGSDFIVLKSEEKE